MPNYTLVADTTFKNRSFDDLIRPFQMYTEVYNQMADSINELDTKASVWEGMANEQSDPVAYAQYKRYADELRTQAKLIATNGTSPSTRQDVLNLRRRYASEIAPIENAYTTRKEQAAEQRKALNADPTLLLSRRADATSLDDYLANPTLGYESYSGAVLASQVGNAAKALAKELKNYGNGKRLDAYTKTWIEQHGFTADEVAHAINNPDDPKSSKVLRTLVDNVMTDSGIHRWADYPTLNQAYNYARQGLWEAVGVDNVHQYEDYGARLKKSLEEQNKNSIENTFTRIYKHRNVYTTQELKKQLDARNRWEKYKDYFKYDDKTGTWSITEEGTKRYQRESKQSKNPISFGSGMEDVFNTGDWSNDFKSFVDEYIPSINSSDYPNMSPEELEEVSAQITSENIDKLYNYANNLYDATQASEYYANLPHSDYNTVFAIMANLSKDGDVAVVTRTKEKDADGKEHYVLKANGKKISIKDKSASDIQSATEAYGKHGNYLEVKLKGEEDEILLPLGQIDVDYDNMVRSNVNLAEQLAEEQAAGITHKLINGRMVPIEYAIQALLNQGVQNFGTGIAPVNLPESPKLPYGPASFN